jgi:DNA-binding IclR family transcriptional regulator
MSAVTNDDIHHRYTIQSLEIAISVLQIMAEHGRPMMLSELSEISGEPASKLHRYLSTFSQMGFVVQREKHGAYALGRSCIQLGLAAMRQVDLFSNVDSGLQQLSEQTGAHAFVAIWTMAGPIIVRWVYSRDEVATNILPGKVLPVTRSSPGKVFSAFIAAAQTEPFIKRELEAFKNDQEYENLVRKKIADTLNDRYAISRGEFEPHVMSVSVPVFDWHDSSIVVAGCVMSVDSDQARTDSVLAVLKKFSEQRSLRPSLSFFAAQDGFKAKV